MRPIRQEPVRLGRPPCSCPGALWDSIEPPPPECQRHRTRTAREQEDVEQLSKLVDGIVRTSGESREEVLEALTKALESPITGGAR